MVAVYSKVEIGSVWGVSLTLTPFGREPFVEALMGGVAPDRARYVTHLAIV